MRSILGRSSKVLAVLAVLVGWSGAAVCQVSPAEITKPGLKRAEQKYLQQLIGLNHAIAHTKFPFPLVLSRYAGLDPKQQAAADQRGLEFTEFDGRAILRISANYNAAFNSRILTENQRANRVFDDVVIPVLQILPKYFSPDSDFDGVGLEISYHARADNKSFTYEGAEVLSMVFSKVDAFRLADGPQESVRQEILDNSQVFVDGKAFGLMLGQRDPVIPDEPAPAPASAKSSKGPAIPATESAAPSYPKVQLPDPEGESQPAPVVAKSAAAQQSAPDARALLMGQTPATQADADALQSKFQAQLQALNDDGRAHNYFVDYAPPSFAIFRNRIYLQLTLRNPAVFDPDSTSIYKRAARSFDLFLAPRLKDLLAKTPQDPALTGLDVTVLTEFSNKTASSSEALEFILPIGPLRSFADADITNQDLINQSVVLVNGVRIVLNLQQVE